MGKIRRTDSDDIDTILAGRFGGNHALIVGIGTILGDQIVESKRPSPFRIDVKCAGHQLVAIVKPGGKAMNSADISPLSAAHHS